MRRILLYYSFIVVTLMTLVGFMTATGWSQIFAAIMFYPLFIYIVVQIIPRRHKALVIPEMVESKRKSKKSKAQIIEIENELTPEENEMRFDLDIDRRMFIKLIGSAGISIFLLSLFTKKAQAAFFGSVPGPGTVALKDSSGNQIDPAEKQPTDGYRIAQVEDGTTSYYGFINKDGGWYILQENASGDYRYIKGASSFSTNWTNRASLTYDYFDNIF